MTLTAYLKNHAPTVPPAVIMAAAKKAAAPAAPEFTLIEAAGPGVIMAGSRNATLSPYALKMLKLHGDQDDNALNAFKEKAAQCSPPLEAKELAAIWNSARKAYREKVLTDPAYIPPDQYKGFDLCPEEFTDVDESEVLFNMFGNVLRYSRATGWIHYTGCVWKESEPQARGCMHNLTRKQIEDTDKRISAVLQQVQKAEAVVTEYREAHPDMMPDDTEKRKPGRPKKSADPAPVAAAPGVIPPEVLAADAMMKGSKQRLKALEAERQFYLRNRNSKNIGSVLKEAQTFLEIEVSELDRDGFSLNTPDGEIDLRTGEMTPNRPESFHTRITKCGPSDQGADLWAEFLNTITCRDHDLADYLQMITGEIIIGKTLDENLIIAYGGGRNGKSTFFNTLFRVMGDYGFQIRAELLTTGAKNGKAWEIGELRGKRLVLAPELEEGTRLNASFVKQVCSTDQIMGEKKNRDPFIFEPSHTVVLFTNFLPKVGSSDKGTWARLVVIPFNAVIQPVSDIKNYADHLTENAGGAVLKWMIEGAKRYIDANFRIQKPQCVIDAVEAYRAANDWLSIFLEENTDQRPDYTARSNALYERYRRFSESNGDFVRSAAELRAALEKNGFSYNRDKKGMYIKGLKIRESETCFP